VVVIAKWHVEPFSRILEITASLPTPEGPDNTIICGFPGSFESSMRVVGPINLMLYIAQCFPKGWV